MDLCVWLFPCFKRGYICAVHATTMIRKRKVSTTQIYRRDVDEDMEDVRQDTTVFARDTNFHIDITATKIKNQQKMCFIRSRGFGIPTI